MQTVNFKTNNPPRILKYPSAWKGLDLILDDLIKRYDIKTNKALEFGVEFGYSTVALSGYFDRVIGVDTFEGDEHAGETDSWEIASWNCSKYDNIKLIKSDYKDFKTEEQFDLIHVDIIHTYQDTYDCGKWAMEHAPVVIFHDTESFPAVRQAVEDLSGGNWDNYPYHHGLGIIKVV
jgi:hypothetical protein